MATFYIENFGCRATAADAAAIEQQFLAAGHARALERTAADVVVLNTCTVTAAADAEARVAIRKTHAAQPAARIVVTGCYAQRAPEELAGLAGVAHVVGNSHVAHIGELVGGLGPGPCELVSIAPALPAGNVPAEHEPNVHRSDIFALKTVTLPSGAGALADHTRPVLKIQDGCDHRCAYCVIPFVRGRSRSLPPAQVVAEVRRLVAGGAKEIVLSGINLGTWGRDLRPRAEVQELLPRIMEETALDRLRLSSLEPMDVTRDLVEQVAREPRLAPHFHVPLQSGSDRVLAAMHRWYRAAHYATRIALIHERLPHAAIGADIICGFPGETDADHEATVELVERLPFSYLHVFSFSARPGTEAARRLAERSTPAAPAQVIRQRARELRAIGARKAAAFRAGQRGQTLRVLTLHTRGADERGPWTQALSDNYLTLRLPGHLPANQWQEAAAGADFFEEILKR